MPRWKKLTNKERLEQHYIPEPNSGCWLWTAALDKMGYGTFRYGKPTTAHRASYAVHVGEIGDKCVLHKCDVPSCVNPDHLFLGTQLENIADMNAKGRGKVPHYEKHPRAILDHEKATELKWYKAMGMSVPSLMKKYGITRSTVYSVTQGRRWAVECHD